jgi:hypothetical protein
MSTTTTTHNTPKGANDINNNETTTTVDLNNNSASAQTTTPVTSRQPITKQEKYMGLQFHCIKASTPAQSNFERIDRYLKCGELNKATTNNSTTPAAKLARESRIFDEKVWWKTIRDAAAKQAKAQEDLEMYAKQTEAMHRMSKLEREGVFWRMRREVAEGGLLSWDVAREEVEGEDLGCEEDESKSGSESSGASGSEASSTSEGEKVWWK